MKIFETNKCVGVHISAIFNTKEFLLLVCASPRAGYLVQILRYLFFVCIYCRRLATYGCPSPGSINFLLVSYCNSFLFYHNVFYDLFFYGRHFRRQTFFRCFLLHVVLCRPELRRQLQWKTSFPARHVRSFRALTHLPALLNICHMYHSLFFVISRPHDLWTQYLSFPRPWRRSRFFQDILF